MKRLAAVAVLLGLLAVGLAVRPAETDAAWSRPDFGTATAVSGVLNPVPTVTCGASSGLLAVSIPITWTAPPVTAGSVAPTGYLITYAGTAGSGSTTSATLSASIPGSVLTVDGTLTVKVFATYGPNWTSVVSLQTRTITTTLGALGVIVGWTCA